MKKMIDLEFPAIGAEPIMLDVTEQILLSDKDFSNKEDKIAEVGDVLRIQQKQDYGLIMHPVHGLFRC